MPGGLWLVSIFARAPQPKNLTTFLAEENGRKIAKGQPRRLLVGSGSSSYAGRKAWTHGGNQQIHPRHDARLKASPLKRIFYAASHGTPARARRLYTTALI